MSTQHRETGFACPNLDGSESPSYTDHTDRAGLDYRLRVMAHREARGQYLRILEEIDAGIEITQPMSAAELRARLEEARCPYRRFYFAAMRGTWSSAPGSLQNLPRARKA